MEDPSFHIAGIKIVNLVLNYLYLGLLVMSYLLALGNRPQGSKWFYTVAFIGFGIITVYMTVSIPMPIPPRVKILLTAKNLILVRRALPRIHRDQRYCCE